MDVDVKGASDEDKIINITIQLDTQGKSSFGASSAFLRMTSDADTFYDLWLSPINEEKSVLQGSFTMSKYSCAGYWHCEEISLTDEQNNQRFAGVDSFG